MFKKLIYAPGISDMIPNKDIKLLYGRFVLCFERILILLSNTFSTKENT